MTAKEYEVQYAAAWSRIYAAIVDSETVYYHKAAEMADEAMAEFSDRFNEGAE